VLAVESFFIFAAPVTVGTVIAVIHAVNNLGGGNGWKRIANTSNPMMDGGSPIVRDYRRRQAEAAAEATVTDQSSPHPLPFDRITSSTPHPVRKPDEASSAVHAYLVCIVCGRGESPEQSGCGKESEMEIDRQIYIRAVLDLYASIPCSAFPSRRSDRDLAGSFYERRIPLDIIEASLLLGLARRLCRADGTRRYAHFTTSNHVEEVAAKPLPSGYIRYLRLKIRSAAGPHVAKGGNP
jgi:hypothetical protein